MKKCVVIYNPHSGKKKKKDFFQEMESMLTSYGYEVKIYLSKYKGHISKMVSELEEDVDLVITIGGDGTFNESVCGNFERKKKLVLSHIPVGTTNDIGKMFGYGKNIFRNLQLLLDGTEREIDIPTINGKPFVYVAGFGKFTNIAYETSRNSKKKLGYLAYLVHGVKDVIRFTKMYDVSYKMGEEEYRGLYSFMLITNATRIAGIHVFRDVKLDDHQFEILFCNLRKRKDIIKTLYYLRKTDITHVPGFYFYKTNRIQIQLEEEAKLPWCIDGEKLDIAQNEVEIAMNQKLVIRIPKTNIESLFLEK